MSSSVSFAKDSIRNQPSVAQQVQPVSVSTGFPNTTTMPIKELAARAATRKAKPYRDLLLPIGKN